MHEITFMRPVLFAYDPSTLECRGAVQAEIDMAGLAAGVLRFIAPAFTTEVPPPDARSGEAIIWSQAQQEWTTVVDRRGETWWLGDQPVRIETIGDPAEQGLTRERPTPPPPIVDEVAERRAALMSRINQLSALGAGYTAMRQPVPKDILDEHDAAVKELRALSAPSD